jgi:hypothetical protein
LNGNLCVYAGAVAYRAKGELRQAHVDSYIVVAQNPDQF